MRRSSLPRPGGLPGSSSSITPPSMGVGCTWPRSNGVSFSNNASIAVSPTPTHSRAKLRPGNTSAMESRPPSTGAFLSPMRARNSNDSIPHFQRDEVLGDSHLSERKEDTLAAEQQGAHRREERARFSAIVIATDWHKFPRGKDRYFWVRYVRDEAGRAVCDYAIMRETAAVQPDYVFTFEAQHMRDADDAHEFTDVTHVLSGGPV